MFFMNPQSVITDDSSAQMDLSCHVFREMGFLCEKNMFLFTTYHDHVVFVCDFRVYDVGLWLQNQLFESI